MSFGSKNGPGRHRRCRTHLHENILLLYFLFQLLPLLLLQENEHTILNLLKTAAHSLFLMHHRFVVSGTWHDEWTISVADTRAIFSTDARYSPWQIPKLYSSPTHYGVRGKYQHYILHRHTMKSVANTKAVFSTDTL